MPTQHIGRRAFGVVAARAVLSGAATSSAAATPADHERAEHWPKTCHGRPVVAAGGKRVAAVVLDLPG